MLWGPNCPVKWLPSRVTVQSCDCPVVWLSSRVTVQLCVSIQMKAIEQYFHVPLFIVLYKVVLTFQCVDETLVCHHWNKGYWGVLSGGT